MQLSATEWDRYEQHFARTTQIQDSSISDGEQSKVFRFRLVNLEASEGGLLVGMLMEATMAQVRSDIQHLCDTGETTLSTFRAQYPSLDVNISTMVSAHI
jgi:hypothetical protein